MSTTLLNAFLKATAEVLQTEAGLSIRRGEISLQDSSQTSTDITTLLNIVGDVRGVVLFGMDIPMALQIISKMLGYPHPEFDDLAQSGIAELGNVIAGIATMHLAQAGYNCDISVPTLIIGHNVMVSTLDLQRLVIPLHTEMGTLEVHLALKERAKNRSNGEVQQLKA